MKKRRKKIFGCLAALGLSAALFSAGLPVSAEEPALLLEAGAMEENFAGSMEETPGEAAPAVLEDGSSGSLWDGGTDPDEEGSGGLLIEEPSADENELLLEEDESPEEDAPGSFMEEDASGSLPDADASDGLLDEDIPGELLAADISDEPSAVGAESTVSGMIYASKYSDNSELVLKENTTLMMDTFRTFKSIRGNFALTIKGNYKLTVKNPGGHGIDVKTLTCSVPLDVTASKNGLNAAQKIDLSGKLSVNAGLDGVHSEDGEITIKCNSAITAGENAIESVTSPLTVTGDLTAQSTGAGSECIKAGYADKHGFSTAGITINGGTVSITSAYTAVCTVAGEIILTGNGTIVSKNDTAVAAGGVYAFSNAWEGSVTVNGAFKIQGKNSGIGSAGTVTFYGGPVTASGSTEAVHSDTGIKILYPLSVVMPVKGEVSGKTIVDSKGKTAASVKIANTILAQTSGVVYVTGVRAGQTVVIGYTGDLVDIHNTSPNSLHYQWQISSDGSSGWTNITGATKSYYFPVAANVGKYIRLVVTADGYVGEVMSAPAEVIKSSSTEDPVEPLLSTASPYTSVTVANAKAAQEYVMSYSSGTPDWSKAKVPESDGKMTFSAEKNRIVYVYTRMRETGTTFAGTKTVYSKIYNGYVTSLADLKLEKTTVSTRVGQVTALTVSPLPAEFSGWNDTYTVNWYVSGTGISLYKDAACKELLTLSSPVSNKTVYVKGTAMSSFAQVNVQKQVGYTDIRRAYCDFEVADASGNFVLKQLNFDNASIRPGETVTVSYTTTPIPAKVGKLSFVKTQGTSELKLAEGSSGKVTVSAPENAETGVYYYEVRVDGARTPVTSSIRITVVPKDHAAVCPSSKFEDVKPLGSAWYHEDVDYVVEKGYMTGVSATTFAPNKTLTRAMVVTILYRMAGSPAVSGSSGFTDVPSGKWYADAVTWAKNKGIATGYSAKIFGPEDPVTREQMVTFLYRFAGKPSGTGSVSSFTDAGKISPWAVDAMKWAVGAGIIKGIGDGTVNPGGTATRAQFAAIVHRYQQSK